MNKEQNQPMIKKERRLLEQEQRRQEWQKEINRAQLKARVKKLSWITLGILIFAGIIFLLFKVSAGTSTGMYPYVTGKPGPGDKAPEFSLDSTTGKTISLADYKGKTVLIFYQEGLMCQPCWRQTSELEQDAEKFKKEADVDQILTITTDPIGSLIQKAKTDGYMLPILSDRDAKIALAYDALKYGMMNGAYPGHSFILIGPDGVIRWRADYGGPPKHTMYLPNDQVLADMKNGLGKN